LPKFIEDFVSADLPVHSITKGFSRFIQSISDLATDAPRLPLVFWETVMYPLIKANKLDLAKVQWLSKNEDELFCFIGHYRIFTELLRFKRMSDTDYMKKFDTEFGDVMKTINRLDEDDKELTVSDLCNEISSICGDNTELKADDPIFKALLLSK
jgi:hypothetical protein